MPSICFLTSTRGVPRNDNHRRLPDAFAAAGWDVIRADHDDVRLSAAGVCIAPDDVPLARFDLIWPIGLGARNSFFDRMQLLSMLEQHTFITSASALLMHHAKYSLALGPLAQHHPQTYASRDPRWLRQIIAAGGDWIVKPPAASFGRNVYRLRASDPNLDVILDALTGHDGSRYCLLQRYLPEIEHGETRVLLADGEVIGAYLRRPGADHRVNLALDGRAEIVALGAPARALAIAAATHLITHGVRFVAIDIAYPWIVEFNIANPGGLETIERLTGRNLAPDAVDVLIRQVNAARRDG
jgi:glutathione synthase